MKLPFLVRQSTITTAECLYRLHQTQILGVREPESAYAARGRDFHEMAKMYVDYLVQSGQESDLVYAEDLARTGPWNAEAAGIFLSWTGSETVTPSAVFATEYQIRLDEQLKSCAPQDALYSGDLDRIDIHGKAAVINDYKTHFAIYEPLTAQSVFYPWLLWNVMPHLEEITFNLEFVRYGASRTRIFRQEDLERIDSWVQDQVARFAVAVERNEWPAAANTGCVYCRLDCPLVASGMSPAVLGQVKTDIQARAMAQQLFALDNKADQLRAILRAWSIENGPIDAGNNIMLGFQRQERLQYSPSAIMDLNRAYGFSPTRALSVDGKEVRRIARNYPDYKSKAEETARDKSVTVFRFQHELQDALEDSTDD